MKGINLVGIIDCASPYVIEDIERFLQTGEAFEIPEGGIIYQDKVCIILGSDEWHHGVIGIVASKITELYYKPSILISVEKNNILFWNV